MGSQFTRLVDLCLSGIRLTYHMVRQTSYQARAGSGRASYCETERWGRGPPGQWAHMHFKSKRHALFVIAKCFGSMGCLLAHQKVALQAATPPDASSCTRRTELVTGFAINDSLIGRLSCLERKAHGDQATSGLSHLAQKPTTPADCRRRRNGKITLPLVVTVHTGTTENYITLFPKARVGELAC